MFVPALPTLWPEMLAGSRREEQYLPFASASVRYFYFARNAIWHTVKALQIDGGEVLVPAYHHGVEIEALVDAGASVRFYRVGAKWDVDLADVESKIGPRTRALYLIHYAGFPGPAAEMKAIARRHGLPLIEDCALSLLSSNGERALGSTGDVGIFCLYKTLPVPNGGALVLNGEREFPVREPSAPPFSSTLSHTASSLLQNLELRGGAAGRWLRTGVRRLGRRTVKTAKIERVSTGTQHFNREHVNLGMSPLTRRIALSQPLAAIVEARRRNFYYLLGRLEKVGTPLFDTLGPGVCPLFFPLVVEDKAPLMKTLSRQGVEAIDFWRHFHPACDASEFPEAAELRRNVLEIPCHQDLGPEVMTGIAAAVRKALASRRMARLTQVGA